MGYDGRDRPEGPVEIRVLPEGESGVIVGRLSEKTVETLASYWAQPEHLRLAQRGTANEYAFLASKLGVSPAFVRRSKRDPRVLADIRKRVNEAVALFMPDIVYAQLQLAIEKRDIKAATFLGKMQGWIKENGITVNTQVGVNVQSAKDGGLSEDLSNFSWLRELKRSGAFDRIPDAKQVTDGSDPTGD